MFRSADIDHADSDRAVHHTQHPSRCARSLDCETERSFRSARIVGEHRHREGCHRPVPYQSLSSPPSLRGATSRPLALPHCAPTPPGSPRSPGRSATATLPCPFFGFARGSSVRMSRLSKRWLQQTQPTSRGRRTPVAGSTCPPQRSDPSCERRQAVRRGAPNAPRWPGEGRTRQPSPLVSQLSHDSSDAELLRSPGTRDNPAQFRSRSSRRGPRVWANERVDQTLQNILRVTSPFLVLCSLTLLLVSAACDPTASSSRGNDAGQSGGQTGSTGGSAGSTGGAPGDGTGGSIGSTGGSGSGNIGGAGGTVDCPCAQPAVGSHLPVVMSWNCFCSMNRTTCQDTTLESALAAAHQNTSLCYARAEYPGCGITALHSVFQLSGRWGTSAFDSTSGKLLGIDDESDTDSFSCPQMPAVAFSLQAGKLPDCEPTTCETFGDCGITLPPPCHR